MAKTSVNFDVGSDSIKMAVIEGEGDHFQVMDYDIRQLGLQPNPSQEEFNLAAAAAIKAILTEKRIKTRQISVSLSGPAVFVRFVKLPAVDESKVEQIIRYEAQQQVPFPIEDVEWDHQLIGKSENGELDIVLVAVRKEVVSSLVEAIQGQGLDVEVVDVSTISLYNSFIFNEEPSEQGVVLIELGAKTTNLLICAGNKLWARSIPIGGDNFTTAVGKEMALGFEVAEAMKKEAVIITPDVPRDRIGDEQVLQVSEILTKVASRLYTEISRSVGYFRSQTPGVSIGRVMLTGGGSAMANIRGFLSTRLKTDVEDFSPFKKLAPPARTDEGKQIAMSRQLSNAIGLGLARLEAGGLSTNLLPRAVAQRRELAKKRVFIVAAGFLLIAAIVVQIFSMKSKTATMARTQLALEAVKMKDEARDSDIRKEEREHNRIESNLDKIIALQDARMFWLNFIDILKKKKLEDVWFTSVQVVPADVDVDRFMGTSMPGIPGTGIGMPGAGFEPGFPGARTRGPRRRSPRSRSPSTRRRPRADREPTGPQAKPRPKLLLQGYLKITGRRGRNIDELLARRTEDVKAKLESGSVQDGTKYFDNVQILDYDPIEGLPNLATFEIQAELVNPLPEY